LGYGNDSPTKPSQSELVAVQATAGTIAGACSSIITTPIDTIKTRLQVCLVVFLNVWLCIFADSSFLWHLSCFLRAIPVICYYLIYQVFGLGS